MHNSDNQIDLGQIDLIRQRKVEVVTSEISHFTFDSVVLQNGKQISIDSVILCTGNSNYGMTTN